VADRPKTVNIAGLIDKGIAFELKTEAPEERESRLRREKAEEAHKRRISLIVHVFVMAIVVVAFGVSVSVVFVKDANTGLPDKAMGIITAIVAGGFGYMTGKGSK
jgi:hypothetical protein